MNYLVVDIETVPDESVPFHPKPTLAGFASWPTDQDTRGARIELAQPDPFRPPACHQVVCIGYALFDEYAPLLMKCVDVGVGINVDVEERLLARFHAWVNDVRPTLVTWNGRGFDVPVLCTRALKYGIDASYLMGDYRVNYRYSEHGHLDVMDKLTNHGAVQRNKLEMACRLIGLPGKPKIAGDDVDGTKVDALVKRGRMSDVRKYCLTDVLQEAIVWLRRDLSLGVLSLETYRESVDKMRELARDAELPAGFVDGIDWERVALR